MDEETYINYSKEDLEYECPKCRGGAELSGDSLVTVPAAKSSKRSAFDQHAVDLYSALVQDTVVASATAAATKGMNFNGLCIALALTHAHHPFSESDKMFLLFPMLPTDSSNTTKNNNNPLTALASTPLPPALTDKRVCSFLALFFLPLSLLYFFVLFVNNFLSFFPVCLFLFCSHVHCAIRMVKMEFK